MTILSENANYVADYTLQNKIVKIQLVSKQLLIALNPIVRRTIGIIAPNAVCKLEKFRSRIARSESCSRLGKSATIQASGVSQGTCGKKRCRQHPSAHSKSTKQIGQEHGLCCRAVEIIYFCENICHQRLREHRARCRRPAQTRYYLL